MAKKSKQMRAALEKIDSTKAYSVEEAVALAKETNFAKFDASVEVAYKLNIDVRKADQQIRGAMVLPNGTGKTQRVLVFARGAKAEEAKAAGADFVGEDDLVAKINDGWLDWYTSGKYNSVHYYRRYWYLQRVNKETGEVEHKHFFDIIDFFKCSEDFMSRYFF